MDTLDTRVNPSLRTMATEEGLSHEGVRKRMQRDGTFDIWRQGRPGRAKPRPIPVPDDVLIDIYGLGLSPPDIAYFLGEVTGEKYNGITVAMRIKRHGIPIIRHNLGRFGNDERRGSTLLTFQLAHKIYTGSELPALPQKLREYAATYRSQIEERIDISTEILLHVLDQ